MSGVSRFFYAAAVLLATATEIRERRTMSIFEIAKTNISLLEAAQVYGIDVNRHGKALCPFHNDRHPSLFVADDHYYCFACGEHGDVIDFTAKLFGLSLKEAAEKLIADFHLDPDKPPTAATLHARKIKTDAQKLRENERLCVFVLSAYRNRLEEWKKTYAPQTPDEPIHDRFVEACHQLDYVEYLLDVLSFGDSHERQAVVNDWLKDNKIYVLKKRMEEEINERNEYRDYGITG